MGAPSGDVRLFAQPGPAGGCASGDCLPGTPPPPAPTVRVTHSARTAAPPLSGFEPVSLDDEAEPDEPPAEFQRSGRDDPTRSTSERWRAAVDAVREASTRHAASLSHARVLWLRPGEVTVGFSEAAEFHRVQLSGAGKTLVESALARHFARPTTLNVEARPDAADGALPSLAEQDAAERAARDRGADQKVRSHPAVAAILRLLGGEIEHVQPLEPERPAPSPSSDAEGETDEHAA